jgi:hypothetical protein
MEILLAVVIGVSPLCLTNALQVVIFAARAR